MTLRLYADRHGWKLQKATVRLRHGAVRTAEGGLVDRFFRTIELAGELSEEQRRRLLAIAERCAVRRTLRQPSEIVTELAPTASAAAGTSQGNMPSG